MILSRLLARQGPKSLENPKVSISDPALALWLGGGATTTSGRVVTPEGAMACSAVMACVRVLAESLGQAPCMVFERLTPSGKKVAPATRAYQLLHDRPNPEMTPATFKETLEGHLALRGNAYAEIERDTGGRPVALWPLRPDRTRPYRDLTTGERLYQTTVLERGGLTTRTLRASQVLHIPGLGYDGFVGYSPIDIARDTVGLALAAEEHGARLFSQGAVPGGVLEHPGNLSKDAQDRLRSSWNSMHQGLTQSSRIAVLEEGMKWQTLGLSNDHAQFIESRKFSVSEVARLYRVPPHMVGDLDRATFSNIEQQGIEFTTQTLGIWVTRWEEAVTLALLTAQERVRYFAEFNLNAFLRGDTPTRYAAYAVGRQWGWLSPNDVRNFENMNPIPNGDLYERPLNMAPLGAPVTPAQRMIGHGNGHGGDGVVREAFLGLFTSVARGLVERDAGAIRKAGERYFGGARADVEGFGAWLAGYQRDSLPTAVSRWSPALTAAGHALGGDLVPEAVAQIVSTWNAERTRAQLVDLGSLLRDAPAAERTRLLDERLAQWLDTEPPKLAQRAARTVGALTHLQDAA